MMGSGNAGSAVIDYSLKLPYGTYKVVASLPNHATQVKINLALNAPVIDIGQFDFNP
jgi:hypothetical protein